MSLVRTEKQCCVYDVLDVNDDVDDDVVDVNDV